jgi:hypothetical protein
VSISYAQCHSPRCSISSSSDSGTSTDEDTDDEIRRGRNQLQGRPRIAVNGPSKKPSSPSKRQSSLPPQSSGSGDSSVRKLQRSLLNGRAFTRSRSPAIMNIKSTSAHLRNLSPMASRSRHSPLFRNALPAAIQLVIYFPIIRTSWTICIDTRKAGECLLLFISLLYAIIQLLNCTSKVSQSDVWISIGSFYSVLILSRGDTDFNL